MNPNYDLIRELLEKIDTVIPRDNVTVKANDGGRTLPTFYKKWA